MAYPTTAVAVGEMITAAHMNAWPVRIANTTLSADTGNIEFTSIPQHYAHLLVEVYARTDQAAATSIGGLLINDYAGGSDYDWQWVAGIAAAASANEQLGSSLIFIGRFPGNTASANLFGASLIKINHYAQATNVKTVVTKNGSKAGTSSGDLRVFTLGGWLRNNEAVTKLTVHASAASLKAGSRATLYGLP